MNPISESKYKSKSSSKWEGTKAILLEDYENIGKEKLTKGRKVVITNKSEIRMQKGQNLNQYYFDVIEPNSKIRMYRVRCSHLKEVKK